MIFLFSISVPIILPFGALFFLIKYLIDKYNIVCVYPLEFESHGYLRQTVCVFMIISIWIFQMFFIGFFLSVKKNAFKAASFIIA
jgi:Calcium-dependent channel, 7TM region, putative phosphate